jgi:hypothetical protein
VLEEASFDLIPDLTLNGRLAYADKFGNVRLEVRDIATVLPVLVPGTQAELAVGDTGKTIPVHIVRRLTEIPEGECGIYYNPADDAVQTGPAYLEFVRRVSAPNSHAEHAYATLAACFGDSFQPKAWEATNIQLRASQS